jgi:hypothetical protein
VSRQSAISTGIGLVYVNETGSTESALPGVILGETAIGTPVSIAAVEAPDIAAITMVAQSITLTVDATEAADIAAITAVYNARFVQIDATEDPDVAAISAQVSFSSITVDIAATELADAIRAYVYVPPFWVAEIAATEAPDTAAISLSTSAYQIRIRATEAPDTAAVFVETQQNIVITATEAPDRALIIVGDKRPGPWYFAWADASETTFVPSVHARWDEHIFELEYTHEEGQSAHLSIVIKNPRIPLLGTGRNSWAWLAKDIGGTPTPRGFFRVVAAPSDMAMEKVKLELVAMPLDLIEQKRAVAAGLMVRPNWDPVFIEESKRLDPDSVLEGYSAAWHIDPITHAVSISDWIVGEDGTEIVAAHDAIYESLKTAIDQPPLKNVVIYANVSWEQYYLGTLDMGQFTYDSDKGAGMAGAWPKAGTGIGQGWSVKHASSFDYSAAVHNATIKADYKNEDKTHHDGDVMSYSFNLSTPYLYGSTGQQTFITADYSKTVANDPSIGQAGSTNISTTATIFFFWDVKGYYVLEYEAKRTRNEQVRFTLACDLQPMFTDPGGTQANFAQDSELIKINGKVGQEGFYGPYTGPWEPNHFYHEKDVFTVVIGGVTYGYQANRDHVSLPTFDFEATATAFQSGMWLDAGTNVYYGGIYYQVMISGNWTSPPSETQTFDPYFQKPLFTRLEDPHSGSRLYTEVSGFRGYWTPGMTLLTGDLVIAPDNNWYHVAIAHNADATFDRFADDETGALLYDLVLNPPPIGDVSYPQYFPTDRGLWSIEYALMKARARLINRARAVTLSYDVRGDLAWGLTLRNSAHFTDARLPAGEVIGKITKLEIKADAKSPASYRGTITIKPVHGTGAEPDPPNPGQSDWTTDGYIDPGYSYRVGASVGADDINYSYPDPTPTDDGLHFPLDYSTAVVSEVNQNWVNEQQILAATVPSTDIISTTDPGDIVKQAIEQTIAIYQATISASNSWHVLTLRPVQNGPFDAEWVLTVSDLVLPQQITIS